MEPLLLRAGAKLNLALDILGRRDDGYHELDMVMHTVALYDTLRIRLSAGPEHTLRTPGSRLPTDGRNLALMAAVLFLRRIGRADVCLDIRLEKRIPVCAGLGGGSADAAAVLRGLRDALAPELPEEILEAIALELGSDVPYCLRGGTRRAAGRGEALAALPALPACRVVLCKPPVSVSTRQAFEWADGLRLRRRPDIPRLCAALEQGSLPEIARCMFNVFEGPITAEYKSVGDIRARMIGGGALGAVMSGTGPTVFCLFDPAQEAEARALYRALKAEFCDTFLVDG